MRNIKRFLQEKAKIFGVASALCLCGALLVYGGFKLFAYISDDARVNENQELTYYITVNGDGIDYSGTESSSSQISDETTGITTVTDVLPDGLTFEGFVTSSDGTFGAVRRSDKTTQCSGFVIDDTNEESLTEGTWNATNTEFTYHGLHYDANSRTVTFRTKSVGAGCELTVGVITRTPTLPEGVFRMDFYDHASFVDQSLFGDSNEVHAYIQKDTLPGEYSLSYRYDGVVPEGAPALPATTYYDDQGAEVTIADLPTLDGYTFDGWYADLPYNAHSLVNNMTNLPGQSVELYGTWSTEGGDPIPEPDPVVPEKYNVTYEIDGTKPASFRTPSSRSYYEGASVVVDSSASEGDTIDGYDFSGWDTDDVTVGNDDSFTMPSRNVTLRGSFDRAEYTLSYEFIGSVIPSGVSLPESETHFAGDLISLAAAPVAQGYTFSGWYADVSFEMPEGDVVIKGEWAKDKTEFTPEIAIEIINPEESYKKGDTVNFKITVINGENFALNDVWLEELLEGAVFVEGDGYTIEENSFANISTIPANSSAIVYSKYDVTKNIDKVYTNTVELIALEPADSDFVLPDDWENTASVDFATVYDPTQAADEDEPEKEQSNAKTYDGLGKVIFSGAILGGGLAACVVLAKRIRRGGALYGYCAAIMAVSGLTVVLINGGISFADNLTETPEFDIYSSKLSYEDKQAGAWDVHESAEWTGVGEAMINIRVDSRRIADLHNKDVILILDNSNWTRAAIDGTEPDSEDDLLTIDIMKNGARQLVSDLIGQGDSRIVVFPTWGTSNNVLTDNEEEALNQINEIAISGNSNSASYSESFTKVLRFLDTYEQSDDRALNVVYVSDDHIADSSDIAKYRMIKSKAPNCAVAGIGIGNKELQKERYVSMADASAHGVVRFWYGVDGNIRSNYEYTRTIDGLEKITDWHAEPWASEYPATLNAAVNTSMPYSMFNLATTINTTDFEIRGIYGDSGDFEVDGSTVYWNNDDDEKIVSGMTYEMGILVKAKDESVQLHKLYKLNNSTTIDTDARDIEADYVEDNRGLVLMNGYQLEFAGNPSTCSTGRNQSGVYLAWQQIDIDEENVACDGWNFDAFRDSENGTIYSNNVKDKMPSSDLTLNATWYKVGVEVHMDGQVYAAARALLMNGVDFNQSLEAINTRYSSLMLRADGCPANRKDDNMVLSDPESPVKIYAWASNISSYMYINPETGASGWGYSNPVFYCSDAETIVMNEDSSRMFTYDYLRDDDAEIIYDENYRYTYLRSYVNLFDDSIGDWDASNVKDMTSMFSRSNLKRMAFKPIGRWNTSSVENLNYLMQSASYISSGDPIPEAFANWNTEKVTTMRSTFAGVSKVLENFPSIGNWDVSNVEDMGGTFSGTGVNDWSSLAGWDTSNVKNMAAMFNSTGGDRSGLSGWDVSSVENMRSMFSSANISDLDDLSEWDTSKVEDMSSMFYQATMSTNDISGDLSGIGAWDLSSVKTVSRMFANTGITDASGLSGWGDTTRNIENYESMFANDASLVSLRGLSTWNTSSAKDFSGLFREDSSLTSLEGIGSWDVSNLETLRNAFRAVPLNDLTPLSNWNVVKLKDMAYAFCGAYQGSAAMYGSHDCDSYSTDRTNLGGPKSLDGLQGWKDKTGKIEDMEAMLAGNEVTDLSPIGEWDVRGVKTMEKTFMHMNVSDLSDLSEWNTASLENMYNTFSFSKITSANGLGGWDVSHVTRMDDTFAYAWNLTNVSDLAGWTDTHSLTSLRSTFYNHRNLTSLDGLQNWDVSHVKDADSTFQGYSPYRSNTYDSWSTYCDTKLTDISALASWDVSSATQLDRMFACNEDLVDLTPLSGWRVHNSSWMDGLFEGDKSVVTLDGLQHWYDDAETAFDEPKQVYTYEKAFMYMTGLRDISALSYWTSSKITVSHIESLMRYDNNITSFEPLNNSIFKTSGSSYRTNAFNGTSARPLPTWY